MNCFSIDFTLCTSFKESLTFLSAKNTHCAELREREVQTEMVSKSNLALTAPCCDIWNQAKRWHKEWVSNDPGHRWEPRWELTTSGSGVSNSVILRAVWALLTRCGSTNAHYPHGGTDSERHYVQVFWFPGPARTLRTASSAVRRTGGSVRQWGLGDPRSYSYVPGRWAQKST